MLKIIFEVKIYKNIRISDTTPNSISTSTWLCATSNKKNPSHKTWQTSHLVLKSLQIKPEENVGGIAYYAPRLKKWEGHVPRVPHQTVPMVAPAKGTDNAARIDYHSSILYLACLVSKQFS